MKKRHEGAFSLLVKTCINSVRFRLALGVLTIAVLFIVNYFRHMGYHDEALRERLYDVMQLTEYVVVVTLWLTCRDINNRSMVALLVMISMLSYLTTHSFLLTPFAKVDINFYILFIAQAQCACLVIKWREHLFIRLAAWFGLYTLARQYKRAPVDTVLLVIFRAWAVMNVLLLGEYLLRHADTYLPFAADALAGYHFTALYNLAPLFDIYASVFTYSAIAIHEAYHLYKHKGQHEAL